MNRDLRLSPVQAGYSAPRDFVELAQQWRHDAIDILFEFVWRGFDRLKDSGRLRLNEASVNLERSITQMACQPIRDVMEGKPPFYLEHHPFEDETQLSPRASPPAPDLGFILRANPRAMFPLEAKVLKTDSKVGDYVKDVQHSFLECRYAPFSSEGGMLGYLLFGQPATAVKNIGKGLQCEMIPHIRFKDRGHSMSRHERHSPACRKFPRNFTCHHLIIDLALGNTGDMVGQSSVL